MRVVILATAAGEVATAKVPEGNPAPPALAWGSRLFVLRTFTRYEEVVPYTVPDCDVGPPASAS